MDGVFDFEEDYFEEESSEAVKQSPKEVQLRETWPKWFHTPTPTTDSSEEATRLKFCGDWAYRQGRLTEAVGHYRDSQAVLCETNNTLRRELLESLTRCYTCLHLEEEALAGYRTLRDSCTNFEQTTVSLQLGLFVYRKLGHTNDLVLTLQQLVLLHPGDSTVWSELARVYEDMLTGDCVKRRLTLLTYLACLYRARFLLGQSVRSSYSFVKCKHQENLQKVTEKLETCEVPTDIKHRISEHMCEDPSSEEHTGADRYVLSLLPRSEEIFHSHWLPWLQDCLVTLAESTEDKCVDHSQMNGDIT